MRILLRVLRWLAVILGLAWALLLLAWCVLQWAILPHIDDWRGRIEQEASLALRVPVRIQHIEVRSGGWMPSLALQEVELLDPQGRVALRLPRVSATLSARSLLTFSLRFEQLLIEQPQLEVRRDAEGHLFVAGLALDQATQTVSTERADALTDWIFSQQEFAITGGRIRWIDESRAAPPLELADLNLVLRNGLRRHSLRLDATPPQAWGDRFSLRGQFTQSLLKRPGELRWWSGQLYAELPRADLRELRHHVDLPFELTEGDGALRAWVDVKQGQPTGATVDLALRAVHMRLVPHAEPLQLAHIEGRVQLTQDPKTLTLQATQLGFEARAADGRDVVWPRTNWGVSLRLDRKPGQDFMDARLLGGQASAERLDFALMAEIAERLPIGKAVRGLLAEVAPEGVLSGFVAHWDGSLDAPSHYNVSAHVDGLRVKAQPPQAGHTLGLPGVDGASLSLQANEQGGQAQLDIANGYVEVPGLFEDPRVPLTHLAGQLKWQFSAASAKLPRQLAVKLSDLTIENPDLSAQVDASWHSSASPSGYLDLSGHIDQVAATRVQRYLPQMISHAREYVQAAVLGGTAQEVQVQVRGELADFPFAKPVPRGQTQGVFRIATQAQDVSLAYVPPDPGQAPIWPPFEKVNAELVFDRNTMLIKDGTAKALGFDLVDVNGGIKDLGRQPVLELDGAGHGPLTELLRFMRASPLDAWTAQAMTQATGSGQASLHLNLAMPLNDTDRSSVKGSVLLSDDELRLRPDVPQFSALHAQIAFDRKGVTITGGQAQALGGDLTFEGGTQRDGSLRFTGQGVATADALRHASELGAAAHLAASAQGRAAYQLSLGFVDGQTAFDLKSTLRGLALDLPAPLHKDADALLPLHVQIAPQSATRDELRVELGSTLLAQYQRDVSGETAHVLRGALALQTALPVLPASGVLLDAHLGDASLDDWMGLSQRLSDGGGAAPATSIDASYAPAEINLRAKSLQTLGRPLTALNAQVTHAQAVDGGSDWHIKLSADQLAGSIELGLTRAGQLNRVTSRLTHLSLPKQDADTVSDFLDQNVASEPGSVPSLDIVVDDFELRGKKLGHLEIQAQAGNATRDWRLSKLELSQPDAVLKATGDWASDGAGPRRTKLDWTLSVQDAGDLLETLGQGKVLRKGKGELAGTIAWLGSPLTPEFGSMSGKIKVKLDAGQFLKAEPGVGRLLGVLSLQSLPRRLLFDFRDVFSEGFAFDDVTGDVLIMRGVATSQNLRMHGVQATIQIDGSADLADETQDLRVVVVPEINAGAASLAYAAINPVVGLGTFLAQLLLSKPLAEAGTRELHITGKWDDPKVETVDRGARTETPKSAKDAS